MSNVVVRYIYIKFIGFLLVILGFSYSMTSFYNFYDYVFGEIVIASSNIFIMSLGLLIPLYMLVFGIYFYFYADMNITKINKFIISSSIFFIIVGITSVILQNSIVYNNLFMIAQITEFLHISLGYVLVILGISIMIGCIKYKY